MFTKRFLFSAVCLASMVFGTLPCLAKDPAEFIILICSYNNAKWCKKNLDSVFCQTYPHWRIHYVDDCSTDGTGAIVEEYIKECGFSKKCTVVHNLTNQKPIANYYYATKGFDPHKIVVDLDGDDWFAHKKVLEKLSSIYQDPNVWMTYGSFRLHPSKKRGCCADVPLNVIQNHAFRKYKWVFSHLRSYYAALFQKISMEDFFYKGSFIKAGGDLAFMLPMIEMASNGHFRYQKEILYIYNFSNPLSVFRRVPQEQLDVESFVRAKTPYKALEKLF